MAHFSVNKGKGFGPQLNSSYLAAAEAMPGRLLAVGVRLSCGRT